MGEKVFERFVSVHTPRANTFLFILYIVISSTVFTTALIFPAVRGISYAPLRDLLLPPPAPVVVTMLYSTEKEAWLEDVVRRYLATDPRFQGRPVKIEMEAMGSREMYLSVLNDERKPVVISPASSLQTAILEDLSTAKFGRPIVLARDRNTCQSVLKSPLVLVAWRERAEVLWGDQPGSDLWEKIHDVAVDPRGWERYGRAEWGYFKFGHTNPLSSNSGFMTILLMTYHYFDKTAGLTSQEILSDQGYQDWFLGLENTISQFGESTGTYMRDIVAYGPSVYDLVSVYEATAIEQADNAYGRYGEVRIYYPPATVMSDHPFCVVNADWVRPDEAAAAHALIDFLLAPEAQRLALLEHGFRPVDASVALDQPGSPFQQYASNGLALDLPPEAELPPGDVLNTLLDFWARTIRR